MVEIENISDIDLVNTFKRMSDAQLHESAVRTAEKERKVTLCLLRHLNEIERRHLFSKFSVSSLHGYCVKELKMCEATAGRRVSAARLLKEIPVIEEKILSGAVNLTSIAQAGVFFRKEENNGSAFTLEEKAELVLKLEDKSTREVEMMLLSNSDQPEIHFKEKVSPKSETQTEVRLLLDNETMAALERLKEIWSNANPHASLGEIIRRAAAEAVEKHDPLRKIERANNRAIERAKMRANERANNPMNERANERIERPRERFQHKGVSSSTELIAHLFTPAPESNETNELDAAYRPNTVSEPDAVNGSDATSKSDDCANLRNITVVASAPGAVRAESSLTKAEIKRAVRWRDQARCTFTDPRTGERCEAKHFLEEDHIEPKGMGGDYSVENIRLRCRTHNQRHAINLYGAKKMARYL